MNDLNRDAWVPIRNRKDGLCPRCGRQPRAVNTNGRTRPYCRDCTRAYARQLALEHSGKTCAEPRRRDNLCPGCGVNERIPKGERRFQPSYCLECTRAYHRNRVRRDRSTIRVYRKDGICPACGVNPRWQHPSVLDAYCRECRNGRRSAGA